MAMVLPDNGQIIACDVDEETTNIAKRYWEIAGVTHKIKLVLAPAIETLDNLIARNEINHYDLAFIDAIKSEYIDYYERTLKLIRPGGIILVDNVLWSGKPAKQKEQDEETQAIRNFNKHIFNDKRVNISMLPLADGLTLARKL
jgi:caffeoyl-CoA O-methyltransferase